MWYFHLLTKPILGPLLPYSKVSHSKQFLLTYTFMAMELILILRVKQYSYRIGVLFASNEL